MDKQKAQDHMIRRAVFVKATDAQERLMELLLRVKDGEAVSITFNGKTIAHLIPPDEERERELRKEAFARFREERKKWPKTGMTAEEINELVRGRD